MSAWRGCVVVAIAVAAGCAKDRSAEHVDTALPVVRSPEKIVLYNAQDDAGRNGMSFVGVPDTAAFKVQDTGADFHVNASRIAVLQVVTGGHTEIWLVETDSKANPTPWTVVATVNVPETLSDSVRVWNDWCTDRGLQAGRGIVAVLNYDPVPTMTRVIRAWHVDPVRRQFVALPPADVTCHNGQAVQDSAMLEAGQRTKIAQAARAQRLKDAEESDSGRAATKRRQEEQAAQVIKDAEAEKANAPIPMLRAPADVKQVPVSVQDALAKRGCRVPYVSKGPDTVNVFRGDFLGTGSRDTWAVWCITPDTSIVLFFRDGNATPVNEFAVEVAGFPRHPTYNPDPPAGIGHYGCVGHIYASETSRTYLDESFAGEVGLTDKERRAPPHDGIEDQNCEGVSGIHYWTGRRWLMLPGAH